MRALVVGSGGREHALAWKLASDASDAVPVVPGNGGTPHAFPWNGSDLLALAAVCEEQRADLVVIGPEAPLAAGAADLLRARGLRVFGPSQAASRLESSKAWAKDFMHRNGVATARYGLAQGSRDALALARDLGGPVVLKYEGLAAGKGVIVCDTWDDVLQGIADLESRHGANACYVVEERLFGDELSVVGITDGRTLALLPPCQDHKQLLEGDRGPNTGGMGAFTPVPGCDAALLSEIERDVLVPTLAGLAAEDLDFRGALYFGLMVTENGPRLLEYNARFGDPETEVLMPALDASLLDLLMAAAEGGLDRVAGPGTTLLPARDGSFVDVVLCSEGYPGPSVGGRVIEGLQRTNTNDTWVFHAGTRRVDGAIVTAGGRVLNVVAHGADVASARARAEGALSEISFEGMRYRHDIGLRPWTSHRRIP
jgi:phosphoribosylamine---glycine ligase